MQKQNTNDTLNSIRPTGTCALSAAEIAELYKNKRLSPVEVMKDTLDHISKHNPLVNAFAHLDPRSALNDAKASEDRWHRGRPRSRIDGVPVTLKDTILARGWPTLCGSLAITPEDDPWETDSPVAARIREAGAVLLGKTTMSEFGVSAVTETERHGITRNPRNTAFSPGGSSGGAAAAAAAGFGQLHVSTDGGGSTRVPASLTGVFGFMPTYGRIPQFPENYQGSRFHIGMNTRTVYDAALLLSVISRPDSRDWQAIPYDRRDWSAELSIGIKGLRVGYLPALGADPVDPEVLVAVEAVLRIIRGLGANTKVLNRSWTDPAPAHRVLGDVATAILMSKIPVERHRLVDASIVQRAERGRSTDALAYAKALEVRATLGRQLMDLYDDIDIMVTPVTTFSALAIGGGIGARFTQTNLFNMTQQPACSLPCGLTRNGLPVGVQIVGRKYDDATVLRVAATLEPHMLPAATT
jgi:aspartyl-tRNA(Asn)/glutamyl-tRNA(Gln) amidotransferase subunit A